MGLLTEGWHYVKGYLSEVFLLSIFYSILASWVLLSGATLPSRVLRRGRT